MLHSKQHALLKGEKKTKNLCCSILNKMILIIIELFPVFRSIIYSIIYIFFTYLFIYHLAIELCLWSNSLEENHRTWHRGRYKHRMFKENELNSIKQCADIKKDKDRHMTIRCDLKGEY